MAGPAFRFVHSSDWHLERPLAGLEEVPDHLRELFVEAPYLAAERVIETALAEKVDAVLLAGDILDARRSGPVGPAFFTRQCERLRERGIALYWALGKSDRENSWPPAALLPDGVARFTGVKAAREILERGGAALAEIVGAASRRDGGITLGEFAAGERFTIGLIHGSAEPAALKATGARYWALGGKHQRRTLNSGATTIHYPGSPQGRSPAEIGTHGCTIVEVDAEARARTRFAPTDVVSWRRENILLETHQTVGDLERTLRQRMDDLATESPDTDLVIHWNVALRDRLPDAGWRHRAAELLQTLRSQHGFGTPLRWSAALEILPEAGAIPARLRDEDTILGDFLREVARVETESAEGFDFARFMNARQRELLGAAATSGASARVLAQAAALGLDFLGGGFDGKESRA